MKSTWPLHKIWRFEFFKIKKFINSLIWTGLATGLIIYSIHYPSCLVKLENERQRRSTARVMRRVVTLMQNQQRHSMKEKGKRHGRRKGRAPGISLRYLWYSSVSFKASSSRVRCILLPWVKLFFFCLISISILKDLLGNIVWKRRIHHYYCNRSSICAGSNQSHACASCF